MTNKEWLDYLAHNAPDELSAWFDAEHVETEERALDGDTEPENADSREQLEADIEEWASIMDLEDQIDMIHGWLNRRAAILEREMVKFNRRYFDCVEQEKKIAELQEQVDKYKELNEYHALQYELASEDADRLQAQVDEKWNLYVAERRRADSNAADREMYREATSALVDSITDGLRKVDAILDRKDEGLA